MFLYLCNPNYMKAYNSNSNKALIQDLGPFKLRSANQSIYGQKIWEYKVISKPKNIGTISSHGKNYHFGTLVSSLPKNS